jgi:hypothetical protein
MSVRRAISTGILTLAALAATAVLSTAPALAEPTLTGTFGSATSTPADPEPLSEPTRIAVDQSNGDVYVLDFGNKRVEKFDGSGNYLSKFDGTATPAKSFEFIGSITEGGRLRSGVAVDSSRSPSDPSAGDVYVLDSGNGVLDKFTEAGVYVSQIKLADPSKVDLESEIKWPRAVAVDQSGNVWVVSLREVHEFNDAAANEEISRFQLPEKAGDYFELALDSSGDLFPEGGGVGLYKLTSAGAYKGVVGPIGSTYGVDPVTGDVYGTHQVYDTSAMTLSTSEGTLLETFGEEPWIQSQGVAVNGLAGKVYITDAANSDVDIFSFPVLPGLTVGAPSVLAASATLSGTVNPVARDANTIQFEYGTTTAYGTTVEASPSDAGSGTSPVPVSASITGLVPDTLYHYRLTATNENGTKSTPDNVLFTLPVKATVNDHAAFASEVSQFAAKLNGTINPGNSITSYHFEYGTTTAYGASIPVPEGFTPVNYADDSVSEQIAGLQAGTTYHFRLVANNAGGVVPGPDETFTTASIVAPAVSTGGASGVSRGESLVSGTIDPHGWSTSYHFEYGTSTAYGSSWPSVDVNLGAFEGSQPVSVTIENLQPGTTYHYRLRATNGGGTSFGPDMAFTTAEYPVSVIQPTPVLGASLGFFFPKTQTTHPKPKHKAKKKARKRSRSKHRAGGEKKSRRKAKLAKNAKGRH